MDGKAWLRLLPLLVMLGCDGVIGSSDGQGPFAGPGGGDVGAVGADVIHRLNQTEYRNTTRDLLGTQLDPAANFPADDVSFGFDNISQVLSVSPLLFELYEQAAQELAGEVLSTGIRHSIVFCDPNSASCRSDVFRELASRAWRRPASEAEVTRLQSLFDVALNEGEGVEEGLELAIRGILLSPHFIYRPELDDDPRSVQPRMLNDYELASRLSYFLWSSMPDETLFEAAANGSLRGETELRAQVDRMLTDPKSQALVDNFAGQWLRIRSLADHVPDYASFPEWDGALRDAMGQEAKLFFAEFLRGNAGSNRSYPFLGASGGHHEYSHHQNDPGNFAAIQTIDTWEVEQLSYLLQRMNEVPEGTGTLLQHSQVFFSSEIEDGNAHRHRNLPIILAGSCHGAYTTGRHIDYEPNKSVNGPPIANLFLSMMAAMGVDQSSFGDNSTGPLGQLA